MKLKIKFGALDIALGLLLVIAVGVNVWAFTMPETTVDQPAYTSTSPVSTTALRNFSAPKSTSPPPIRKIASAMSYVADGDAGAYTGEVENGVPEGYGEFRANIDAGWSYEGAWHNGLMHGEGVQTYPHSVFQGTFSEGKMNGEFDVYADTTLRYRGGIYDGKLNGQGTLFTATGTLIYEGAFIDDMLDESAGNRTVRGEAFAADCQDMSPTLYDSVMAAGGDAPNTRVHVSGSPIGMSEQNASGTIILAHMDNANYPVALSYRYGIDEPKVAGASKIDAWGVVSGVFSYDEQDGFTSICPLVEVVYLRRDE